MAKILVVDDDAHIRELVGVFLKREGFEVTEAEDGSAALEAMERSPAELVILDIMMPGITNGGSFSASRCFMWLCSSATLSLMASYSSFAASGFPIWGIRSASNI